MSFCTCPDIMLADPNRHFRECPLRKEPYSAPKLVQLRLEEGVGKAADKWWKVEEWLKQNVLTHQKHDWEAYALRDFIVELSKE